MIPGWNNAHTSTVRAWYGTTDVNRLAKNLHMTVDAVHAEAVRLGFRKAVRVEKADKKSHKSQSEKAAAIKQAIAERIVLEAKAKEDKRAAMLAEYPTTSNAALALKYGYGSADQVARIAAREGVRKSADYASMARRKSGLHAATNYNKRVVAMRLAIEHLRTGDHMTALNILEEALA